MRALLTQKSVSVRSLVCWALGFLLGTTLSAWASGVNAVEAATPDVPRAALQYKRDLIRYARIVHGINAPISALAGQIHQESGWKALAKSPYAAGLTQFTPDTAKWVATKWPELKDANVYNPQWAIQAMILYDQWLYNRSEASTDCDRYAMALAGYNGGAGWIDRDKKLTKQAGKDPLLWWGNVELYSNRAAWAIKENRHYPAVILLKHQAIYKEWGTYYVCADRVPELRKLSGQ